MGGPIDLIVLLGIAAVGAVGCGSGVCRAVARTGHTGRLRDLSFRMLRV
ncbi:MAG: hypothetical protein R3D60_03755 [Paracoccaceae bacterium]